MLGLQTPANKNPWRRRMYLPSYGTKDAARYAGTSPQTVSYWRYRSGDHGPTLPGKQRHRPLSYLELVEVAFVATFRKLGVSLKNIRLAREYIAQTLNSEFPFVEYRFKTDGRHLLIDFAEYEPGHELDLLLAADSQGQLGWQEIIEPKFAEFDYEHGLALVWHAAGRQSPVSIDPRISFGAPMIKGVPTWAIKGRYDAGESIGDMQDDFDLTEEEIHRGLDFEGIQVTL